MVDLPPFPVDDTTLGLLEAAMNPREHGDPDAEQSSVWPLLEMLSALGGSDPEAVADEVDGVREMRDPIYTERDVISALIAEVRQLRKVTDG